MRSVKPLDACIAKLFAKVDAREVQDLRNLLERMSEDYSLNIMSDERLRDFFARNRRYLTYLLETYGKPNTSLDEAIDEMLNAIAITAMIKPGRSFSQIYYRERLQKTKEEKKLELL